MNRKHDFLGLLNTTVSFAALGFATYWLEFQDSVAEQGGVGLKTIRLVSLVSAGVLTILLLWRVFRDRTPAYVLMLVVLLLATGITAVGLFDGRSLALILSCLGLATAMHVFASDADRGFNPRRLFVAYLLMPVVTFVAYYAILAASGDAARLVGLFADQSLSPTETTLEFGLPLVSGAMTGAMAWAMISFGYPRRFGPSR